MQGQADGVEAPILDLIDVVLSYVVGQPGVKKVFNALRAYKC